MGIFHFFAVDLHAHIGVGRFFFGINCVAPRPKAATRMTKAIITSVLFMAPLFQQLIIS